jgi:crotonobetaine/carnitine-CoA ligase
MLDPQLEQSERMRSPIEVLSLYAPHDGTLCGLMTSRMQQDRDHPFVIFGDATWSRADFHDRTARAARMLASRGIGKGDRVAMMAANSDAYVIVFFAVARIGAILVPVNPDFGVTEVSYIFGHAGIAAVACTADTLQVARRACEGIDASPWFMLLDGRSDAVQGFGDLVKTVPAAMLPDNVGADDICLIMYTSGTTGFPKGVMHSQRNFVLAGEGFVERMHLQPEDRLLCVLPLFHINALLYSVGGAAAAGAAIVLAPRFSASGFWQLVEQSGATEVNIIAAVGNILARRARSEFVPGHRLTKVYGAPITREIADVFVNEFAVPTVIEGYGMTEIPGVCNIPFMGPHKIGSMGRPAVHPDCNIKFAELRIVDEGGRDVPQGDVGELLVRTPIIMKGYYRDPEQTAAAFRDGWFITGDLVKRDPEGFYYFVARKKDIIRKRGENISGAELDRVIGLHPDVAEAAAIAVPSELGEDEILVAVVTRAGATLNASDIGEWCARHLAPIKMPRYVVFVDSLPHTPTHRVAKFKLKNDRELLARAVDLQGADSGAARSQA